MEITLDVIKERKLEMLKESQEKGKQAEQLNAQLQYIRGQLAEMEIELRLLDKWETKLKEV